MTQPIIALCGYAGSGKTTAAKALYSVGYTRIRFAETLKSMLRSLGLTDEMLDGALKEEPIPWLGGKTPRYLMQTLGTEWGRELISDQIWVKAWLRKVETCKNPIVCDDLRFPNEVAAVKAVGGKVIRVVRPGIGQTHTHASEDLGHIDHDDIWHNNGNEPTFHGMVRGLGINLKNA